MGMGTGRTGEVDHLGVAPRHELDVHCLPDAGGVDVPRDVAVGPFLVDIAGSGRGWGWVGVHEGEAGEERGQDDGDEHRVVLRSVSRRERRGGAVCCTRTCQQQ